jgi:two-component system sensor histidine kinase CpxA
MRSLFVRILIWLVATVLLAVLGFMVTERIVFTRARERGQNTGGPGGGPGGQGGRVNRWVLNQAQTAYEGGGKDALRDFLDDVGRYLPGQRHLLDQKGNDLVTGENFSQTLESIRIPQPPPQPPLFWFQSRPPRRYTSKVLSKDGAYTLLVSGEIPGSGESVNPFPYFAGILILVTFFSWVLAVRLVRPMLKLRETVIAFGNGDLSSRANSNRQDEMGDLARSFDQMADRLQTLLTAERRLLQDVSHELRSPLARLGFAVELARTSANKDAAYDRIKREAQRLNVLVGELLQVTRAEGDPGSRNLEPIDVGELVRTVAEDCSIEAEVRHCRIIERNDETIIVTGDRELLHRAVENIVRNAIRHAPESTSIEVICRKEKAQVLVGIRDYGSGVPEELLTDIFRPFFRVDDDRNRASGGVGLGLAIAQRAVSIHHGGITAKNMQPGLLVEISLPVAN